MTPEAERRVFLDCARKRADAWQTAHAIAALIRRHSLPYRVGVERDSHGDHVVYAYPTGAELTPSQMLTAAVERMGRNRNGWHLVGHSWALDEIDED